MGKKNRNLVLVSSDKTANGLLIKVQETGLPDHDAGLTLRKEETREKRQDNRKIRLKNIFEKV